MSTAKKTQAVVASGNIDAAAKPRVRDRIFQTARDLFYRHGIRAVGVDTIACEAGTNKMSFYRSFPSKDDLVAEYLRDQEREGWEWWEGVIAKHEGDVKAQVIALFEAQATRVGTCDTRGCPLANAAVEIVEEGPARTVVEQFKHEMRRRFRKLARDLGAREPDALGDAFMLLWEGSYLTRLTFPGRHGPVQNAARAARTLIDAHLA